MSIDLVERQDYQPKAIKKIEDEMKRQQDANKELKQVKIQGKNVIVDEDNDGEKTADSN